MLKNVQTSAQLYSFHMYLILQGNAQKSFKLGFNSMWTKNFQMYKLDLENAEEPEIKLPTSTGSQKKQENSRKNTYFCFIDYAKAFDCVAHNKLWKILKEMGIPHHLTCLLRNLYAGQEATVRTRHGTTDWFKIGKVVRQGCILSPCLFKCRVHHMKCWTEWSTSRNQDCRENINNLRHADDTTLMAEIEEEPKSLLMKVKEESEKAGLKLYIQKMKIMASSPIASWQIDGETMETVTDFLLLGSKITADGDCSHEIKRRLVLGRKAMTNLDSVFKSRDITLLTKICIIKAIVFPVVTYGCDSWTIKKAEHRRIDAFFFFNSSTSLPLPTHLPPPHGLQPTRRLCP